LDLKFTCLFHSAEQSKFSYANFNAFMNRAFSTHSRFNSLHVRCAPKLGNFYNAVRSVIAHDKEAFLMKNTGHTLAE